MPSALIIGSGPASAAAALALAERRGMEITVLDLGLELEADNRSVQQLLATMHPAEWDPRHVALITSQPVDSDVRGLPEKRAYGSDFPFRDVGQLADVKSAGDVNTSVVSAAYGGFSAVWGAQVMPFSRATLDAWPICADVMQRHYRAVLERIPYAAEEDDLATLFPLVAEAAPLPALSARSRVVLDRYERHRTALRRRGVVVGRARLAFDAGACTLCGLCMTGCPYSLVYSAAHTFDELRRAKRVVYRRELMVVRLEETETLAIAVAKDLRTGRLHRFEADRCYVGCGALGTTRLVAGSLPMGGRELTLQESAQFALPFVSSRATADPRTEPGFTLNQFNMLVALDGAGVDVSQLHFYTYNPAFADALRGRLGRMVPQRGIEHLLRRMSVALGYLPSWASPGLRVRVTGPGGSELPELELSRERPGWRRNAMFRQVLSRIVRAAPRLDLWPVLSHLVLAGGAKSYHWGSSFPHRAGAPTLTSTDELGRVGPWRRIHLVDASVFPNIPATTFTLTIMANSHRIATSTLDLQ